MADRLSIDFPIDEGYFVHGSITGENEAYIFVMSTCRPDCPFYLEACDPGKCPYNNPDMERELLDRYEDKMVEALNLAAATLGIDLKIGGVKHDDEQD